ncbi:cytochrome c oxidase subunit 4 isoform 1, mitochondrial-like [Orussus abietinus]|uniref:cytochrome c oxidase subunit 4 isoform 1, mitochondrial-like n=1 Tax=Orussus abietinus TaxID=222816 RepID=UPI0006269687|nr:cytochrome c oxidase subunit 4 isoform 1, mitochondrial-like [Orussus abietinus]
MRVPSAGAYGRAKIGNREVVGFGMNGEYSYIDRCDFPFPAIRYRECTPDFMALREKERGDWRKLSLEEKRCLYRASFCQTFTEFEAPTSEWKSIIGWAMFWVGVSLWLFMFVHHFVYEEGPKSFSRENRIEQYYRQVAINNQPFTGNYRPPGAEYRVHDARRKTEEEE